MANPPVKGESAIKKVPAVAGEHTAGGEGVRGNSSHGTGTLGTSESGVGVWGGSKSSSGVGGMSESGIGVHGVSKSGPGVRGDAENGDGVFGFARRSTGVHGMSETGIGVRGDCDTFQGVYGHSNRNAGVVGESEHLHGVFGTCHNPNGAGVYGTNDAGGMGVQGESSGGAAVFGHSEEAEAIYGETNSPDRAAIAAFNLNSNGTGAAFYARKVGNLGHAAWFEGDVHVTQTVSCEGDVSLRNGDCAEEFTVSDPSTAIPGSAMIIREDGKIQPCNHPYDHRVVGVISGAGPFNPALILDNQGGQDRCPVALLGKVYCLVDAAFGKVVAGDLLTTSETLGHAMRADDAARMVGTIIGKALATLETGRGLIPVLVASRW
jgi:hypothetical protein